MIYVINDMELLSRLSRCKLLENILTRCNVTVSSVRLSEYSYSVQKEIEKHTSITVASPGDNFGSWIMERNVNLSIGDVSSIYVSYKKVNTALVLSEEDLFVQPPAAQMQVSCLAFDAFILRTLKDQKMLELYNLIKVAS